MTMSEPLLWTHYYIAETGFYLDHHEYRGEPNVGDILKPDFTPDSSSRLFEVIHKAWDRKGDAMHILKITVKEIING
jgi:hypothetical protein